MLKPRSKSQSNSHSRGKIRGFNTKGYFFNIQPYCQQYLRAKHATYERSRKLRESKNEGKQNSAVMFQFNKPKSGFYLLKGCRYQGAQQKSKEKLQHKQIKNKPEYLNYFLKKYTQRKEKFSKAQKSQNILPLVKAGHPQVYPTQRIYSEQNHSKSIGLQTFVICQSTRPYAKKLKTEAMENQKNKSFQVLAIKDKSKSILTQIRNH